MKKIFLNDSFAAQLFKNRAAPGMKIILWKGAWRQGHNGSALGGGTSLFLLVINHVSSTCAGDGWDTGRY
jgi:hypothetical protein